MSHLVAHLRPSMLPHESSLTSRNGRRCAQSTLVGPIEKTSKVHTTSSHNDPVWSSKVISACYCRCHSVKVVFSTWETHIPSLIEECGLHFLIIRQMLCRDIIFLAPFKPNVLFGLQTMHLSISTWEQSTSFQIGESTYFGWICDNARLSKYLLLIHEDRTLSCNNNLPTRSTDATFCISK